MSVTADAMKELMHDMLALHYHTTVILHVCGLQVFSMKMAWMHILITTGASAVIAAGLVSGTELVLNRSSHDSCFACGRLIQDSSSWLPHQQPLQELRSQHQRVACNVLSTGCTPKQST